MLLQNFARREPAIPEHFANQPANGFAILIIRCLATVYTMLTMDILFFAL